MIQHECLPGKRGTAIAALAVCLVALAAGAAWAQPAACNPSFQLSYTSGPSFGVVGSTYRVRLTLGAGDVVGGTSVTVNNVLFNLDCDDEQNLGLNCPDDTALVSYAGNLSDTCAGVDFSTVHALSTAPNQVDFAANVPLVIPENTAAHCVVEFDIEIEALDTDGTTGAIEQSGGYTGTCDNTLSNAAVSTGSLPTCPVCDDGLFCDGVETCSQTTGQCVDGTPVACDDDATCTTEVCDEAIDDCVYTPDDSACDDQDVCTDNICDPEDPTADAVTGCTFPTDTTDPDPSCVGDFTCRTCGFWKNHPDIVQDLLDDATPPIEVCGGPAMDTTDPSLPTSATEAMCITGGGFVHLARDLTCLALNCQFSGAGSDCEGGTAGGTDLGALFEACNTACETAAGGGSNAGVGACIERVDCINNGGTPIETSPGNWTCAGGECSLSDELCGFEEGGCAANTCSAGFCTLTPQTACTTNADCTAQFCDLFEAPNCHQLDLCPEGGDYCFEPPGSASPGDCKKAQKSKCTYAEGDCPP